MTDEEKIKEIKNIISKLILLEKESEPPYLLFCCDHYSEAITGIIEVLKMEV